MGVKGGQKCLYGWLGVKVSKAVVYLPQSIVFRPVPPHPISTLASLRRALHIAQTHTLHACHRRSRTRTHAHPPARPPARPHTHTHTHKRTHARTHRHNTVALRWFAEHVPLMPSHPRRSVSHIQFHTLFSLRPLRNGHHVTRW